MQGDLQTKRRSTAGGKLTPQYKENMVAPGFSQVEGMHYFHIFAPVGRFWSGRLLLSVAAVKDLHLQKMEAITACLNEN